MLEVNNSILEALEQSRNKLSDEAINHIKKYLLTQLHPDGGFVDRAGKQDPYYSVFGYTLAFEFDLDISIKKQSSFLENWTVNNKIDFVHAVSLVRCYQLILAIQYKCKDGLLAKTFLRSGFFKNEIRNKIIKKVIRGNKELLRFIESFRSKDNGFNYNSLKADKASVYATFLAWTLYQDLGILKDEKTTLESIRNLRKPDGCFVNEPGSKAGVTTTTAAGLIMTLDQKDQNAILWLKNMWIKHGGFVAAEGVAIADLLSTSTTLLALKLAGESMSPYTDKCTEFINLHWDNSGGFFGSVADTRPDCEYTYYALLALGLIL
jgi:prenyltransferase beta subunit